MFRMQGPELKLVIFDNRDYETHWILSWGVTNDRGLANRNIILDIKRVLMHCCRKWILNSVTGGILISSVPFMVDSNSSLNTTMIEAEL